MATKLLNRDNLLDNIRQFRVFDDFTAFTNIGDAGTTGVSRVHEAWLAVKDVSCSASLNADGIGGELELTTDDVDNEEIYLYTENEVFQAKVDKPVFAIMRAKLECVTDNQADMIFGLMDAVAANSVADASTIAGSKHMAVLFKPDGVATLTANCTSTAAGTYNATTTEISIAETYHTYGILIEPVASTDKRVTYYYDPDGGQNFQQLRDTNNDVIQHTWSLADTAEATGEMALMAGVKAGSAEAQVLTIDYMGAWQLR